MSALADYIHGLGLKFGLYTAQGSRTCQNRPGAYDYELLDAKVCVAARAASQVADSRLRGAW